MARYRKPADTAAPFNYAETRCQNFSDLATFAAFCAGYPDRAAISTYVYRVKPVIDRRQMNVSEKYLTKTSSLVDDNFLLTNWGSGRYMAVLNDLNREGAKQVAKWTGDVTDPTREPVVNPSELVMDGRDGEENQPVIARYLAMGWTVTDDRNELLPDGFRRLAPPPIPHVAPPVKENPGAPGAVMIDGQTLLSLLSARGSGGNDDLERAFQIAERLKPPAGDNKLTEALVLKAVDALIGQRAASPAPAPPSPLGQLGELKQTIGFLREEFNWGGPSAAPAAPGSSRSWIDAMIALPAIFESGAKFFGSMMLAHRMMPAPGAAVVPTMPIQVGPPAPVQASTAGIGESGSAGNGADDMLNPVRLAAMMDVGQRAVAAIAASVSGDDFAEQLCSNEQTAAVYDDLVSLGRDGILTALAGIPGIAEKMAPKRAEYVAWIDAFLDYATADDEEEPEPAAPSRGA